MTRDNLLGEFLQARRARVRPDEVGLASYGRRRVPGLRRDELAQLAGVSVQYLTGLDQGGDRRPSPQDEFRSLWGRHDVRPTRNEIKRFDHPDAGRLILRRQTLAIAGAEDQVIIVYQPEPGSSSADALARLL